MKEILRIADLLDLTAVQTMADSLFRATGMPIGIHDAIDGSILVGAGWQDICVKFHRVNEDCLQRCLESEDYIKKSLIEGDAYRYKCMNGLWDMAIPIMVKNRHLATMFLGQLFYEGEVPDREFFIRQAGQFGFDLDGYLEALDQVPVFSREKVDTTLQYNKALVAFISTLAENTLSQIELNEAIKRNEERYVLAQRVGNIGTWDLDVRSGALYWSGQIEPMFGFAQGEFEATYEAFLACVHPDDRQHVIDSVHACVEQDQDYNIEHRILWPDQTVRWVSETGNAFRDDKGHPIRMIGVVLDITERKQAEEEIRCLNEELEQRVKDRTSQLETANESLAKEVQQRQQAQHEVELLNKDLQKRSEALELANRELESFSSSVSHDLRSPLRQMAGYSRILLEDYGDTLEGNATAYIARIEHASNKMGQLIDSLLQLSRISQGDLKLQTVDLSRMAAEIVAELQEAAPEHRVQVEIDGGLRTMADPMLMRSVLQNLLGNAWKYTRDVSPALIAFSVTAKDGRPVYSVRDNGVGFDMAYIDKLFSAFQRLHGPEYEGTGIGLATAQRIVQRHGGAIWATGKVDEGATFYFTLSSQPLARSSSPFAFPV